MATSSQSSISLSWSLNPNGGEVKNYSVRISLNEDFSNFSLKENVTSPLEINNLNSNSTYFYEIIAENSFGQSSYKGKINTLDVLIGALPLSVSGITTNSSVLTWSSSLTNTKFKLSYATSSSMLNATTMDDVLSPLNLTNLLPNRDYFVRITSSSDSSSIVSFKTLLNSTVEASECVSASSSSAYYVSENGNDLGAGTCTAPWKTLSKVNSMTFSPGSSILFKRGDTFYGTLSPKPSTGSTITFGAYGTGAKPILTGLTSFSSWTNVATNLWESNLSVGSTPPNLVVIKGVNTPMGRYPNSEFLKYTSHSGNVSITGTLPDSPNWKGAEVVIRKHHYMLDIADITSHSGSTLTFANPGNNDVPSDGFGYFVQDHIRTLDVQNEWYYNPSTQKIVIYSVGDPGPVQVATVKNVISVSYPGGPYITQNLKFEDLSIRGSNSDLVYFEKTQGITIDRCDLSFAGSSGIYNRWNKNISISNSTIHSANKNGISVLSVDGDYTIINNRISDVGMSPGMIGRIGTNFAMRAITMSYFEPSAKVNISGNSITSVGYHGIEFTSAYQILIKNNYISRFCSVIGDGGGIYTYAGGENNNYDKTKRIIESNIIVDGQAPSQGAPVGQYSAHGIYMDNRTHSITIVNNTMANNLGGKGYHGNDNFNILFKGNTLYNNNRFQFGLANMDVATPTRNFEMTDNIFFSKNKSDACIHTGDVRSTLLTNMFTHSNPANNIFARPLGDAKVFYWYNYAINPADVLRRQTLDEWQAANPGIELNSQYSTKTVSSEQDILFEYNQTASSKVIKLEANYVDVNGTSHSGSITLPPYTSIILMK